MNDITTTLQDLTHLQWSERAISSGTTGTYLKARNGTGERMIYYKLSRFNGLYIDGHECVNEVIASRLMSILGIEHLSYRLVHARVHIDGKEHITWLNASRNFRREGERKVGLGVFYDLHKLPDETPYEFCARQGWDEPIRHMMLVDYLMINRDRHASNIEVLLDRDGNARLAPLFDTGLSLLAPLADKEDLVEAFDPLAPVRTTNFVGSRLLEENIAFAAPVPHVGTLSATDRDSLLYGLEEVLPSAYLDKIQSIIWERWRRYEALCRGR